MRTTSPAKPSLPGEESLLTKESLGEPDAHVMMRRARRVVRWLLILALVSTIALFLFMRPIAYLAAIPVPILFVIDILISQFERQSRAAVLRRPGQTSISHEEIELDVQDAGIYTGLGMVLLLALGTFIVAASLFDWALVGIGATAGFLLAVLINLPYLPLIVNEAERDEREKVTHQSPSDEGSVETSR